MKMMFGRAGGVGEAGAETLSAAEAQDPNARTASDPKRRANLPCMFMIAERYHGLFVPGC